MKIVNGAAQFPPTLQCPTMEDPRVREAVSVRLTCSSGLHTRWGHGKSQFGVKYSTCCLLGFVSLPYMWCFHTLLVFNKLVLKKRKGGREGGKKKRKKKHSTTVTPGKP